jgi:hypothetical protein
MEYRLPSAEGGECCGQKSNDKFLGAKQAQALAEQSKELGQSIVQGAKEMGRTTSRTIAEASRKGSKAA